MKKYFFPTLLSLFSHGLYLGYLMTPHQIDTENLAKPQTLKITNLHFSSVKPNEKTPRITSQPKPKISTQTQPAPTLTAISKGKKPMTSPLNKSLLSVKDFLPTSEDLSFANSQGQDLESPHHYRGQVYQDLQIDSNTLHGVFDVPLIVRELVGNGSALLKVEPQSKGAIRIKKLIGTPYLRAVVYEALKNPSTKDLLMSLAKLMSRPSLSVELVICTQLGSDDRSNKFEESVEIYEGHLVLKRMMYADRTFGSGGSGIALPDKDAEKSRRHDRLQANLLRLSPAYQAIIRNRVL